MVPGNIKLKALFHIPLPVWHLMSLCHWCLQVSAMSILSLFGKGDYEMRSMYLCDANFISCGICDYCSTQSCIYLMEIEHLLQLLYRIVYYIFDGINNTWFIISYFKNFSNASFQFSFNVRVQKWHPIFSVIVTNIYRTPTYNLKTWLITYKKKQQG